MSIGDYRFAFDVGSNTLGWAVYRLSGAAPCSLVDGGVLVFPDGRNQKNQKPLNEERRDARGQRRRHRARRWRRDRLIALLRSAGLIRDAEEALATGDPYTLRARAAAAPVSGPELARVLLHLAKHRGFASNAIVATDKDAKNELNLWEARERDLEAAMMAGSHGTVGALLAASRAAGRPVRARKGGPADVRPPTRNMIAAELGAVQKAQSAHHRLDPAQWQDIEGYVIGQRDIRPLKPGLCFYEWKADKRRAYAALPTAAAFRIAQDLCHLRWRDVDADGVATDWQPLTPAQWESLRAFLVWRESATWDAIRKQLGLGASIQFNVETRRGGARKQLKGNPAGKMLSGKEAFGKAWRDLAPDEQDAIVDFLLQNRRVPTAIVARATAAVASDGWGLATEQADAVVKIAQRLATSRASLSLEAMQRILPHLVPGTTYDKAAVAAGYPAHTATAPELREALPYYGEVLRGSVVGGSDEASDSVERRLGRIPNVTVHVALNRLRRLVNALIRQYGRPKQIAVELLREAKAGTERRREIMSEQRRNREANEEIDREIEASLGGARPVGRGEARRRWRLWKEQEECCIYTGRPINASDLFSDRCEIDHIVPRSLGGLERTSNEVVCFAAINRAKGERTPWQAFHEDRHPEVDWDKLAERVQRLYGEQIGKLRRFGPNAPVYRDDGEGFLPRQFADASYAARLSASYLRTVCPDVWATRGIMTHSFRKAWGLPKDRADLRNHYTDAAVIGLTDRARVQRFQTLSASGAEPGGAEVEPWPGFRQEHDALYDRIVPVEAPQRLPQGALHDETLYSLWRQSEGGRWTRVRLPVDADLPPDAEQAIWRRGTRQAVSELFPENGLTEEKAQQTLDRIVDAGFARAVAKLRLKSGMGLVDAIRAHLAKRAADGYPMRGIDCFTHVRGEPERPRCLSELQFVPRGIGSSAHRAAVRPNANLLMEVRETDGRWASRVISQLEAARGSPRQAMDALVARLHIGDLIELDGSSGGRRELWRVSSFVSGEPENRDIVRLWPAVLSGTDDKEAWRRFGFGTRHGRSVASPEALRQLNPRFLFTTVLGWLRRARL